MKITDPAKQKLEAILQAHPGKFLRIVYEGPG